MGGRGVNLGTPHDLDLDAGRRRHAGSLLPRAMAARAWGSGVVASRGRLHTWQSMRGTRHGLCEYCWLEHGQLMMVASGRAACCRGEVKSAAVGEEYHQSIIPRIRCDGT